MDFRRLKLVILLLTVFLTATSSWRTATGRVSNFNYWTTKLFLAATGSLSHNNGNTTASTTTTQRKHVALLLGVRPTLTNAPKWLFRRAWKLHNALLPLLHWNDVTVENKNALKVLWCKAIASVDPQSVCQDDEWTYDMMPDYSRWWILKLIPISLYPRLHHANVEYRTVFLNRCIQQEIARLPAATKIRLVAIGGGYDVRATRMLSQNPRVHEAWELDLPVVIDGKRALLERLKERREKTKGPVQLPELLSVDLNDLDAVRDVLAEFPRNKQKGETWHTIYVIEGVMMFLNDGQPKELFQLFREAARAHGENASICFADHLTSSENSESLTDEEERETVKSLFGSAGWNHLIHWAVKPGKAKQMGCVRIHD
ncbi:hypothetical protein FisN_5Hh135 [Fistulifera solaris]|uniref:S-adenosyl-L-methionine-dependent methyltransferase n=1 Tax=Fistulifera solaris TaxID=1519565 RepID=A0A1Z5JTX2_FISSO|nr:hypothetical protein FisN_5Hh135 [Fistulifera solaris]|eukprot:GAX17483.1 hypothetical protein FisN_5Hh135 [Fistulifera solaris]